MKTLQEIMPPVYTIAYVGYDQLHKLTGMYNHYTEKEMNKCLGLLCRLWLETSSKQKCLSLKSPDTLHIFLMSRNVNSASKLNFSVYSVCYIPPMTAIKDNSSLSNHSVKGWLNFCRVSHRLSTVYNWPGNYFWFWRAGETHPYVTPLGRRLGMVVAVASSLSLSSAEDCSGPWLRFCSVIC